MEFKDESKILTNVEATGNNNRSVADEWEQIPHNVVKVGIQ